MLDNSSNEVYFVSVEVNWNVMGLVNATNGNISAKYEYGPFGEVFCSVGDMAKVNLFGFSTKYTDSETDLLYYGYRYYSPALGRWMSRDPIEERGGLNLYNFGFNAPIMGFDILGNKWWNPFSWGYDPEKFVEYPPEGLINKKEKEIKVGKCQIVVLFGHGGAKENWKWKINECGLGTAIMCWPERNSKGIEDYQDIWPIDIEKPDEQVYWNYDGIVSPNDANATLLGRKLIADKIFDLVYNEAGDAARKLCKGGCCGQVRVRFIWIKKNGTIIYNPSNIDTDYLGDKTIQDYVYSCKSNQRIFIPR